MRFIPRFIPDGRAVALDGYIHRVNENVIRRNLPVPSASATLGGASEFRQGPYAFHDDTSGESVVSLRSSWIRTWHDRADAGDGATGSSHTVHASSQVEGLAVGGRLSLERAGAYLKATYGPGDLQPSITPEEATLDGLVIDGVRFRITLNAEPVRTYATCSRFHEASEADAGFRSTHAHRILSLRGTFDGDPASRGCYVYSLVERVEWDGALPPGAEVDEQSHVIVWPDFGKVILGEMLIGDFSRRVTMLRLELGSPLEGSLSAADIQSGGQGLP